MELRHLRYFVAVAEELNFRRAAHRVHVTQPSLSAQIRQLEQEIGVRLLDRDTHRVALTPAGARFLDDSKRVLREAEESVRTAQRVARGETGELSIGFVASLGHGLLPRVLRTYRQRFPDVNLRLSEMDTNRQIEAINNRRLDLGFIGFGMAEETSDLQLAIVAEEPLYAILPQGHPLLGEGEPPASLPLLALAKEPFLLASRQGAPLFNPWLMILCHQAGFQPQIVQEADQPVTVLNYVAAGVGVTILPAQFSRLATVGVVFVRLEAPVPPYRYCAAWLPNNRHSAIGHFIEIAKEAAREVAGFGPETAAGSPGVYGVSGATGAAAAGSPSMPGSKAISRKKSAISSESPR